jgi:hypothetical protein
VRKGRKRRSGERKEGKRPDVRSSGQLRRAESEIGTYEPHEQSIVDGRSRTLRTDEGGEGVGTTFSTKGKRRIDAVFSAATLDGARRQGNASPTAWRGRKREVLLMHNKRQRENEENPLSLQK